MTNERAEDPAVLAEMVGAGTVTPVIERTHLLREAAAAVRDRERGHARGKVVVTV